MAALLDGHQVAGFRTFDGMLPTVDSRGPFTGLNVLWCGIVGTRGNTPTVASPPLKQVLDLSSDARGASLRSPRAETT